MAETTTEILKKDSSRILRKQFRINGIVQGVGFRPFIYNLADQFNLTGSVSNSADGVMIEVQGNVANIDKFSTSIESIAPPISMISSINSVEIPLKNDLTFSILQSQNNTSVSTLISPDVAVCSDCIIELFNPEDRRFLYPFINCTNCGPRYTIIENIPYDRPYTSMRHFELCAYCQEEYDDPKDRRFHAQPNACPDCGPEVQLHDANGKTVISDNPIRETVKLIHQGKIAAIKGLGGFHLAVDASNAEAVKKLRKRKGREEKPLAIMVKSLVNAKLFCHINMKEEVELESVQCPIVLLRKRNNIPIVDYVSPGNDRIGIMLPYTPLHHLLFYYDAPPLVMTSANLSEEPICIENDEAFSRLEGIADCFLTHNRDIYLRSDDSVVISLIEEIHPIRRSRGYAPSPIFVKSQGPTVLAVGGELKNTVCLLKNDYAFISQHIGDLENLEAFNFFTHTIDHLKRVFESKPELIAHDLHPEYLSTKWVKEQSDIPTFGIQHHHAHLASCMAENNLKHPVIGIIMDGTGYGTDGTIWGGEILIGDFSGFQRFAHFEPMPLPGGDAAIKAPWRTAVAYLQKSFGKLPDLPFLKNLTSSPILEMVEKDINCPLTSSCGRLFDAVAAMCGGLQTIRYEGQAAIEFMQKSDNIDVRPFDFEIKIKNGGRQLLVSPIIRSVVNGIQNGESIGTLSSRFHRTLIDLFVETVKTAKKETGISHMVMSGGVFQNHVLFEGIIPKLQDEKFTVFTHKKVPMNDGGLSLGQAMIARHKFKTNKG
ncbi:MAG: carbamoyltransferase HypF [Candidatus Marinimicrobia bacterium]|nr:carbamoyltransferase HypF [Candidatus Neomarinimicrobiota bacterium]